MTIMNSLVFIAMFAIVAYVVAMVIKNKEIPESISSTVFNLDKKWKWVFSAVMWIVGFLLMPPLMEKVSDSTRFIAFFMVAGILFVGASPLVAKEKNTLHYVCAAVAGIASQLLVALNQPLLLLIWFLYIGYTLAAKDGSRNFFWVEVSCMLSVFVYCLT